MNMIELRGLSLARARTPVLHDVSLEVAEGEVLMLIGPSGSGKSSLLRCINRLEEPAPASVFLRGQDVAAMPVVEVRRRVGMIFQKTAVFEGTIAENINYGPSLRGETLPRDRLQQLMHTVALDPDMLDHPAAELSGGQEQRLALARALANEPEVLLLDEPTSALDPIATRHVEESLEALRQEFDVTMIWVSHLVAQARRMGDRVALLEAGRLVAAGGVGAMLDPEHGDARMLAFAAGCEDDEVCEE